MVRRRSYMYLLAGGDRQWITLMERPVIPGDLFLALPFTCFKKFSYVGDTNREDSIPARSSSTFVDSRRASVKS